MPKAKNQAAFFKIQNAPDGKRLRLIPWDLILPNQDQTMTNHGKTLDQLNEDGGLTIAEVLAILVRSRFMPPACNTETDELGLIEIARDRGFNLTTNEFWSY